MAAARKNLLVDRYSPFNLPMLYRDSDGNPVDLTGATLSLWIGKPGDENVTYETLTAEGNENGEFTFHTGYQEWPEGKNAYIVYLSPADSTDNGDAILFGTLTVRNLVDV